MTTRSMNAISALRRPVTVSIQIEVDPAAAYALISDPPAMTRFTAETASVRWIAGGPPATVGATFRGHNRNGVRRWSTTCHVTDADGETFGFEVFAPLGVHLARWQYDVAAGPDGDTCVVTETSWIKVPLWFGVIGIPVSGVLDRPRANREHMRTTLDRLKRHLERGD